MEHGRDAAWSLILHLAKYKHTYEKMAHVNKICCEQLREQSRLFQKLKPTRLLLSSERKLYIAGEQLFRCNAPHPKQCHDRNHSVGIQYILRLRGKPQWAHVEAFAG